MPAVGDVWHRFEDVRYSVIIDAEREHYGSRLAFEHRTMMVTAVTPKCVWLGFFVGGRDRLVRLDAKRKFYWPTETEALESFIARKSAQVRILNAQLADAKQALRWAQRQQEAAA